MPIKRKRLQIRKCSGCGAVGHNRATCPEAIADTSVAPATTKPAYKGVGFFVHHVSDAPTTSAHVVNLRKQPVSAWDKVNAIEPDSKPDLYAFNHQPTRPTPRPLYAVMPNKRPSENRLLTPKEPLSAETRPATYKKPKKNYEIKEKLSSIFSVFTAFNKQLFGILSSKPLIFTVLVLGLVILLPGPARSYYHGLVSANDSIVAESTAGFMALQNSTAALLRADLDGAKLGVNNALNSFADAMTAVDDKYKVLINIASALPVLKNEVANRQNILLAGQEIALGNTYLIKGINDSIAVSSTPLKRAEIITNHLRAALPNYESAIDHLRTIEPDSLPVEYQSSYDEYTRLFSAIVSDFKKIVQMSDAAHEIFGGKGLRRYLVVFQNESELRPTGGFAGSFAVMTVKDGQLESFKVSPGGSYDLQGQLDVTVEPPAPLLLLNKRWEFQDANWFPHFPASAEKMLWFYQHSRNQTADGVITINSSVLERLLAIIGPITDNNRNLTITADNAINTIQEVVENGPEKKINKPKQIIADLADQFLVSFKNLRPGDILPIIATAKDALEKKEIQLYVTDWRAEKTINDFGFGGSLITTQPEQDYLHVVNTNIQGQKTDSNIKQHIAHQAEIMPDGTIQNTVVITREHTGISGEKMYGATNINYLRIYVPEGSDFISAGGFVWPDESAFRSPAPWSKRDTFLETVEKVRLTDPETGTRITNEFGKTAFGNWVITEPGQTSEVYFTYRLPYKINLDENGKSWKNTLLSSGASGSYRIIVQKQSGCDSTFESQIITPANWSPAWSEGKDISLASNGMVINSQSLDRDQYYGLVFTKK